MTHRHYPTRQRSLWVLSLLLTLFSQRLLGQELRPATPGQMPASVRTSRVASGLDEIRFRGQVPDNQTNYRLNSFPLCPNVVDPLTGGIASQPYQFEFTSTECLGNAGTSSCRARPSFIWTVRYFTESGNTYTEQWQDTNNSTYSKVRFYLYDRMPGTGTPTNWQATQAGGNTTFSPVPYPNPGCLNPPINNAQAGELFTKLEIECTGYSCGFWEVDEDDEIEIVYYNRRVPTLSIAGNPTDYCRNQTYTINWGAVTGATSYNVTASGGATVSNISGTSATLSLANVPTTTFNVNVTVTPVTSNSPCGTTLSASRNISKPVQRAPGTPTSLQLSGSCPSPAAKAITVDFSGAAPGMEYRFVISNVNNTAGAFFSGANNGVSNWDAATSRAIITPNAGDFTVSVQARLSECAGPGPALSKTFQTGNIAATCPTVTAVRTSACNASLATLLFDGVPGQSYYITQNPYNITPSGTSVTLGSGSSPTSTGRPLTVGNSNKVEFDMDLLITSPCPPATGPGSSGYTTCTVHVYVQKFLGGNCRGANSTGLSAAQPEAQLLYPNPASGQVQVQPRGAERYQGIEVRNLQGKLLLERRTSSAEGITNFDVQALPTGLYEVRLFDGTAVVTQRLVRE
ncbi:T9SS type A sorting domain-containing protein [Hymenobacter sp. ASUV-10]|uniref:T9SS type A sorting domain-containing protein n=1 Tax=Hymenobacter aranciens TaxID=3063996 RepID=A0ABT9BC06_9BACT|nr:T9SS type A sorting domain-containing protein [Hymenobacter sp. ASUV-10]MDO7875778.1 T9SS type A sorting domain-containing protein [Hymenobacter sp. ASUV-10]